MYLDKPKHHIAFALTSLVSTMMIGVMLWMGLSSLVNSEPQSSKWYVALVGSGLTYLLLLAGIVGVVLNTVAFARGKTRHENGRHLSY